MKNFIKTIILNTTLQGKQKLKKEKSSFSSYQLAKGYRILLILFKRYLKDFILISAGIFSASFGFKGFLLTNHFLVSALTQIPLYQLIIAINIPFVILGYKIVGKAFAIKTALAISGLALCVATVNFPNVTDDNILVAVFGGFFLGAGIGLSIRGGAVIDGTEVLAIFLSRKFGVTIGDIIIAINVVIFAAGAYLISVEIAMFSMITYLSASKTLDFIVEGIEEYIGVTIISSQNEAIRQMIIRVMGHGVTIYKGKKGLGSSDEFSDVDIVYTVITRLELNKLKTEIEKIEPNAFIVMSSVKDTLGGVIKKRPLH
jgi:uncharacterized membrane-anchored protein YitT (DUF2179 family)